LLEPLIEDILDILSTFWGWTVPGRYRARIKRLFVRLTKRANLS
jgi:hypothetical protein